MLEVANIRGLAAVCKTQDFKDTFTQCADEIERLTLKAESHNEAAKAALAEVDRLRAPFRAADDQDWEYLLSLLDDGGRGRFWKAVIAEIRSALKPERQGP